LIMEDDIKNWLRDAFLLFFKENKKIITSNLKEECLNHRLACCFEKTAPKKYSSYYVDVEYDKRIDLKYDEKSIAEKGLKIDDEDTKVRPDIVIHRRTCNTSENLIVIECKKKRRNPYDVEKLNAFRHDWRYLYKYGLAVVYRPKMDGDKFKLKINDSEYVSINYDLSDWDFALENL